MNGLRPGAGRSLVSSSLKAVNETQKEEVLHKTTDIRLILYSDGSRKIVMAA